MSSSASARRSVNPCFLSSSRCCSRSFLSSILSCSSLCHLSNLRCSSPYLARIPFCLSRTPPIWKAALAPATATTAPATAVVRHLSTFCTSICRYLCPLPHCIYDDESTLDPVSGLFLLTEVTVKCVSVKQTRSASALSHCSQN